MVKRGLAESRTSAQELISTGSVLVAGSVADNPSRQVAPGEPISLAGAKPRFVSRGGLKLEGALDHFGITVSGCNALDVGASTGGFTDCLLQWGAASVVALDVGHGQLHERIRADERVAVLEKTNIRTVDLRTIPHAPFNLITADVSFISLRTIAPVLTGELALPGADLIVLVKPQFEAGKAEVSKGKGIVRNPETRKKAVLDVVSAMASCRAATMGVMKSPLLGAEGNAEYLVWLRAHMPDGEQPALANLDMLFEEATP